MEIQHYFEEIIVDVDQLDYLLMHNNHDVRLLEEGGLKMENHCHAFSVLVSACENVPELHAKLCRVYTLIWTLLQIVENKLEGCGLPDWPSFQLSLLPTQSVGRPSYDIQYDQVAFLRNLGMSWSGISKALKISRRTLYRKKAEWSFENIEANISNEDLAVLIQEILTQTPNAGEVYVLGSLRARKVSVARWRVREQLHALDHLGRALRRRTTIQRRIYQVKGANYLWHIDSNHKLISYRLVYHGCIDGYSRLLIYLRCLTNNKAASVLELFKHGTNLFGIPSRVRGDRGVENIHVAQFMLNERGIDRGSFIVGRSVHNQRIERLWAEVNRIVTRHFKDLFLFMSYNDYLDEHSDIDLFCLHYVFLPRIEKCLEEFVNQWNHHSLSSARAKSPFQLWSLAHLEGQHYENIVGMEDDAYFENPNLYGLDEMGPPPEIETSNSVVVPEFELHLSDQQMHRINVSIPDVMSDDGQCGISHYLKIREILLEH
ncbi:hypothetical protein PPYR_05602 [Photinus pyralis]|uniref:Integrase catalytic domain-containing protein n=1 Tax=Photinus pyralis TaxID=7054 RepID=A0A1Y1LZY5_PHOPY|nr:uncharacterized protein LOC116165484 [Photinus pyralis]KAB0801248.1 hypothetical protein PPYR_05602 [Photinus pyralis]